MASEQFFISVILCTYNRELLLKKALNSLLKQTIDGKLFEIIVVDNSSTDGTSGLVSYFQKKYKSPKIRYIYEKKQGLAAARNKGVRYALGKYVTFLDDDAIAGKNWLEIALNYLINLKIEPIAIGGQIIPVYDSKKPDWFRDKYEEDYKGEKDRFLSSGESFSGSNMLIKKTIVNKYGGFNENIGMKGATVSVGEETDLFEKIWKDNPEGNIFFYSPKLKIYHLVAPFKISITYKLKRSFAAGQALYIRKMNTPLEDKLHRLFKYLVIIIFAPLILFWHALFTANIKSSVLEVLSPFFYAVGFTLAFFGIFFSIDQKREI